jgi:hypothetical protein
VRLEPSGSHSAIADLRVKRPGASAAENPSTAPAVAQGALISFRTFLTYLILVGGGSAYYLYVYRPAHPRPVAAAYVLGRSVKVVDSPTEIHLTIETLQSGQRVDVLGRRSSWLRIRLASGNIGWVEAKSLIDQHDYDAAQNLLKEAGRLPAQIGGHTSNLVNLHLEPSRDTPQVAQLSPRQKVEILVRRLVEKPQPPAGPPAPVPAESSFPPPPKWDAWYLLRSDSQAGWALGRLVDLDVPEEIGSYTQEYNLVACLVLNTVEDEGRQVPQYLVADRMGTQEMDFNHIRVLTWGAKKQKYATAYVESKLNGYFPIRVFQIDGTPYFRLRLVDSQGRKYQKLYAMLGTRTRPLGTVRGWENEGMAWVLVSGWRESRNGRAARKRGRS